MHRIFRCFGPPPHSSFVTTGRGIDVLVPDGSGGPGFRDVTSVRVYDLRIGLSPLCFTVNALKSPGIYVRLQVRIRVPAYVLDRPAATVVILRVTGSRSTWAQPTGPSIDTTTFQTRPMP